MIARLPAIFLLTVALLSLSSRVYSFPIRVNFWTGNTAGQSIDLTETEVRIAFPNDVAGGWSLIENVGDYNCPDEINHTTWRYRPDTPVVVVPHNTILQDGARCDSVADQKVLELYQSDNYADFEPVKNAPPIPDDVKGFLRGSGINIDINFALNGAGENFFFGAETILRECGGMSVFRRGTTVYIVRPFNPFRVRRITEELQVNFRYQIIVPAFQNSMCVYRNALPGAEPAPEPTDDVEEEEEPDSESPDPVPVAPQSSVSPPPPQMFETPTPDMPMPGTSASPDADTPTDMMSMTPTPSESMMMEPGVSVPPEATPPSESEVPGEDGPIPPGIEGDMEDESVEPSPDEDDNVCFPAEATVTLSNGKLVRMDELQVGDEVQVGNGKWSRIFGFSHRHRSVVSTFVVITTGSGHTLRSTPSHFIYVNGVVKMAQDVKIGDYLTLEDGTHSMVSLISSNRLVGLYNPQTEHGDIIVDGLRATTFTASVDIKFAHAALAPFRALYHLSPFDALDVALNAGLRCLAGHVPKGQTV